MDNSFPKPIFLDESRLIVDIPAVSSTLKRSVVRADHYLLKKIRVGHHADKVRLVFDVSERPVFSLTREDNKGTDHSEAERAENFRLLSLRTLMVERLAHLIPRPVGRCSSQGIVLSNGRRESSALRQAPFKVQRVQMAGESAPAEKDDRSDDMVVGQTRFVGRRISLDFQQADITNILRLIAEVSGFNIVVGEGVKSKVTMKLVSVPWDQALDMLLKMNGLGMIRQGSIVWVDSLANIGKQQDEEARAKRIQDQGRRTRRSRLLYQAHRPGSGAHDDTA